VLIKLEHFSRNSDACLPFSFRVSSPVEEAPGELEISGKVRSGEGYYRICGQLTLHYEAQCARCLAPVPACLEVPFDENFVRASQDEADEHYHYEGLTLDLTQMAADAIALNLPMRHLCRPDCRGLCPVCGADRNREDCGCETADRLSSSDILTQSHEEV